MLIILNPSMRASASGGCVFVWFYCIRVTFRLDIYFFGMSSSFSLISFSRYNADLNSFIPPGIKPLERPSSAPSRRIDSVTTANAISVKQTHAKATSDQTVLRKIQTASRSAKCTEDRLSTNVVPFLANEAQVFQEHRSVLESELGELSKQVHALKTLEPDMKREFGQASSSSNTLPLPAASPSLIPHLIPGCLLLLFLVIVIILLTADLMFTFVSQ